MTAESFDELLNGLSKRSPFHSLVAEVVGGHRYDIDHPEALVVRDGVAVFLQPGGTPIWFDHESVTQFIGDIADTSA